jgi:hypothetical protein
VRLSHRKEWFKDCKKLRFFIKHLPFSLWILFETDSKKYKEWEKLSINSDIVVEREEISEHTLMLLEEVRSDLIIYGGTWETFWNTHNFIREIVLHDPFQKSLECIDVFLNKYKTIEQLDYQISRLGDIVYYLGKILADLLQAQIFTNMFTKFKISIPIKFNSELIGKLRVIHIQITDLLANVTSKWVKKLEQDMLQSIREEKSK